MRLLDRYLLRELIVPLMFCLGGFLLFWIAFDLFGDLKIFQQARMTRSDVVEYYLVKLPEFIVFVMPIGLLLALLYALNHHARYNEITAIRTAGVSLARLALPYFGTGFVFSVGLLALNELWVPQAEEAADDILTRRLPTRRVAPPPDSAGAQSASRGASLPAGGPRSKRQRFRHWERGFGFHNQREGRTWLIESYNRITSEMVRPHIDWTLPDGTRRVIEAERASRLGRVWNFTNLTITVYPAGREAVPSVRQFPVHALPELTETPEQIRSEVKVSRLLDPQRTENVQLSLREILDYQRLHPGDPTRRALLGTRLHGRLAAPWTCLVVVTIALPFGAATGRRNVYVGVASSIVILFAYYVLQQFALALGTGGHLRPWIAAWTPNVLFAALGVTLTWRVR